MPSLLKKYNSLLDEEGWKSDSEQVAALRVLGNLLKDITAKQKFSFFKKPKEIKGVYLYGGVGRGKSMLMDLFFAEVPEAVEKRRVHFHEFMIETHDWLHAHRGKDMEDLLPSYARHVAQNIRLLCFDEFHVTDVADAMILGRLFTALLEKGVVVVATSNWAPDNLYEGGLQRQLFLPFIALLKQRLRIVHLDSETDYRQLSDPDQTMYYFFPLNKDTQIKADRIFKELSGGKAVETKILKVKGRQLEIHAANDIARFDFSDLCEQPLGAEDYIKIAKTYDTILVENVPVLKAAKRNEAKRFILLIDCLYEAKSRLIITAEADIDALYEGSDHAFEFDRTISRLMEMQSLAYHENNSSS